jgi:hypothetical protein
MSDITPFIYFCDGKWCVAALEEVSMFDAYAEAIKFLRRVEECVRQ